MSPFLLSRRLPPTVALAGLLGAVGFWQATLQDERRELEVLAATEAEHVSRDLRQAMTDYGRSLANVAALNGSKLREPRGWQIRMKGLAAAAWADTSGRVAWVDTPDGSAPLGFTDLGTEPLDRAAMTAAADTRQPALTGTLPGTVPSFHLFVPVYEHDQLQGYVVGVFVPSVLYSALVRPARLTGWALAVFDGPQALHTDGRPARGAWLADTRFTALGRQRTLLVGPTQEFTDHVTTDLPLVVLGTGTVIALLLGASTHLAQSAWRRATTAEIARRTAENALAAAESSRAATEAAQAELRDSEERYRLVFDANPQPLWVYDPATLRFLTVNESAVALYGWTREDFLGMRVTDLDVPAPADGAAPRRDGDPRPHRRKDGATIEVELASHPVRFAHGEGHLVLARDVTETRKLEAQLRHAQKLDAIGHLAGGVAHDFNNILGVITGYADLIQRQAPAGSPLARRIDQIGKAAGSAAGLTRQLLAFSRRQVLQPRVIDLGALVGDMEKMLHRLIGEHIQLTTNLARDLGRVRCDPGQMEQVLMNLAVNARDAMPDGGSLTIGTANVDLDAAYAAGHVHIEPGRYVMLSVSDTGHGMTADVQSRIFEPFFTTKEAGKGTGLGLATVHGIVKQSGGQVFVYSEPGHGTSFKVYLPRIEGAGEAVPAANEPEPPRGTETILLVEDEASLRGIVHECLDGFGYEVLEAAHPARALELAERHPGPIDLLMTDMIMPGMNGRELRERLGTARPGLKVLFMSGYTDDAIVHHAVLSQGTGFLQKPFTTAALARKLREVLDL